jgi:hypothetical protein
MTVKWMPVLLMVATGVCGWGQAQPLQRFALTVSQVAQTLSVSGVQIAAQQVSLPAKVVATRPNPELDVLSVEPLRDQSAGTRDETSSLVKMACHQQGACLPFYAIVRWPEGSAGRAADLFNASGSKASKPQVAVIMRAGTHATLVMDDGRSHIQIAVMSLESGKAGQRVRVASLDHKLFYQAVVVSANLLKGSF